MPETKTKRAVTATKMKRRQVLLPDDLYQPCAELGAKSNVSASAIIRYAVSDFLTRKGLQPKRQ